MTDYTLTGEHHYVAGEPYWRFSINFEWNLDQHVMDEYLDRMEIWACEVGLNSQNFTCHRYRHLAIVTISDDKLAMLFKLKFTL